MSKDDKPTKLVPRRRFPEFQKDRGWTHCPVVDAIKTIIPPKKLQTNQYLQKGCFPVIDQSPDSLCGWTNDKDAIIYKPLPAIVFGDHTCVLKIASVPFAQGADGIKIIIGRNGYETRFLYQLLSSRPLKTESYKRHFTQLKAVEVACPPTPAEQRKIAECLGSLDDWIAAETRALAALRQHKTGLMQQLFPRPGETRPRLRFPEFQDAGEWEEKALKKVSPLQRGFDLPSSHIIEGNVPIVYSNGIRGHHNEGMAVGPGLVTGRSGTLGKLHFIESGPYWPHNTTLWVTDFCGNIPRFVFYLFAAIGFDCFASGSGVPTLNRNDAHDFLTSIPTPAEQYRIADCLASLDALIAFQADKLTALRDHKRGLMQQLFPVPEVYE